MKLKWVFKCHQTPELQKGTRFIFWTVFSNLILSLTENVCLFYQVFFPMYAEVRGFWKIRLLSSVLQAWTLPLGIWNSAKDCQMFEIHMNIFWILSREFGFPTFVINYVLLSSTVFFKAKKILCKKISFSLCERISTEGDRCT